MCWSITQLVSRYFLKLVILGALIASPLAWYFAEAMASGFCLIQKRWSGGCLRLQVL